MKATTWTVDIIAPKYIYPSTHYFRSEREADNFISQQKSTDRIWGIPDVTYTKESHRI